MFKMWVLYFKRVVSGPFNQVLGFSTIFYAVLSYADLKEIVFLEGWDCLPFVGLLFFSLFFFH